MWLVTHLKFVGIGIVALGMSASACRKSGGGSSGKAHLLTTQELQAVANQELILSAPEVCEEIQTEATEETAPEALEELRFKNCEQWLGQREDGIGLTHYQQRLGFSIEEVDGEGRFRIAVYPDCNREERLAEASKNTPEPSDDETDPPTFYTGMSTGLEDVVENDDPEPLVGDASLEVVASTEDEVFDHGELEKALAKSPFSECRKLIAPGAASGDPVEVLDPDSAGDLGWWKVFVKEGERPTFVSADNCDGSQCQLRLYLGNQNTLATINQSGVQFGLKSIFKKIRGSLSKTWNAGVQTVSEAAKSVGKSTNVSKLGNKKLYVAAATPAARLYDAAKEQGAEAISEAKGVYNGGAVYVKIGAEYVEKAGEATLKGINYIAEYIQANACFLGVATGLASTLTGVAGRYEASLQFLALTYQDDLKSKEKFDDLMDEKGEFYVTLNAAALAISLPTAAFSQRYNVDEWREIIIDIIGSALTGKIRVGFVGIIISKLSKAICLGVDEALSPEDAVNSVISTNGISDECLNTLKDHALKNAEAGRDFCDALQAEIKNHAAVAPADGPLVEAWESGGAKGACPSDRGAEAYRDLLEGVGCKESLIYTNDETPVDPSVALKRNNTWTRTRDWWGTLKCASGQVAVGVCSSGGSPNCYGMPKEMLCAGLPGRGKLTESTKYVDKVGNTSNTAMEICPGGYAVTEFCSSGGNKNCDGNYMKMRCSRIADGFEIDYGGCTLKAAKSWDARLQATSPNDVVVGACTSGKKPDCGHDRSLTKSALFCPVRPVQPSDGTYPLFRFTNGSDYLLTAYLGENPEDYDFDGVAFRVYSKGGSDRRALYRCRTSKDHFASFSSNCEGQIKEGTLGYVSKTKAGPEIWRCYGGTHYTTINKQDCLDKGKKVESSLGYSAP